MLGSLSDFCQFKFIDTQIEYIVQSECKCTFQSCRRGKSGTQRHITGESSIESFYVYAAFNHFTAYTEDISCPACTGSIFFLQTEFHIIFQIDGISFHNVCTIRFNFSDHTFIDCSREYKTTVIVCMLTNEVDASRRSVNCSCCSVKMLDETASYVFYIHNLFKFISE